MEAHASLPVMPNGWPGTVIIDLTSNSTTVHSCGIVLWGVALNEIHWYGTREGEGSFGMLVLVVTTGEANLVQRLFPFFVKYEAHEAATISSGVYIPQIQVGSW